MKTNIFYKVAAVTNSSPKLGEVPQAEEYVRTSATSALTDSLGASATPPNLGGESRYSIRKASVLCTLCAVLFLASCTQDDIAPAHPDSPLTITATIPGDVWAVATRAEGESTVTYSDWTLHYTDYTGQAATGTLTATSSQDGTYTLTSGSDLVWAKVQDTQDADETFHLTCKDSDGATYYATTTAAHGAQAVAFNDAMKPTLAKITVNFTLSHNMANAPSADDFDVIIDAKMKADSYDPMTHGGTWPAAGDDAFAFAFTLSQQSAATGTYTVTGSMLLPQQTMGNIMIVEYKETTWTLDLSAVAVTGGEEGKMANRLIAGQHLTLNLKAGLTAINTPSDIQIEAFTAADADADDYNPDLGGVAKTYEYDDETNTYIVYDERCIETALANRAVNHPNAAVVSKAPTLAVVDGTETDLATVQAAIAGKTTIYVLGTTLAEYSGTATTVVGEAICTSNAANSTISLVMPEVTTIGDYAFYDCDALKTITLSSSIENTGLNAFSSTSAEISYNGMSLCIVLGELSIDNAGDVYNEYLPAIIANGSLCVKVDGMCNGREYGMDTDIDKMKRLIQSAIAKGVTGVYVTGTYLVKLDVFYGNKTVLGKAIEDFAIGTIDLIIPNVSSIPQQAFTLAPAIKSLTFGSVITNVGEGAFDEDYTPNCDLTLAAGHDWVEEGENMRWEGYTWKSITLK